MTGKNELDVSKNYWDMIFKHELISHVLCITRNKNLKNGHMLYCLSFVCVPPCKILASDILCGTVMCSNDISL